MKNPFQPPLLLFAGATQKELARQVGYTTRPAQRIYAPR